MGLNRQPPKPRWYERNWFKGLELAAIIIGVGAICFEIWQRITVDRPVAEATLQELMETQRERARATILSDISSPQERRLALEGLARRGYALSHLVASCETLAWRPAANADCFFGAVRMDELNLAYEEYTFHVGFSMEGIVLHQPNFSNWTCFNCDFRGTKFVEGRLHSIRFEDSDLTSVQFLADEISNISIAGSNVSSAIIEHSLLNIINFTGSWYWSDFPPQTGENLSPNIFGAVPNSSVSRAVTREEASVLGLRECPASMRETFDGLQRYPSADMSGFFCVDPTTHDGFIEN